MASKEVTDAEVTKEIKDWHMMLVGSRPYDRTQGEARAEHLVYQAMKGMSFVLDSETYRGRMAQYRRLAKAFVDEQSLREVRAMMRGRHAN